MASRILQFPATERRTHQANAADFSREGISVRRPPLHQWQACRSYLLWHPLPSSTYFSTHHRHEKGVTPSGIWREYEEEKSFF